MASAIPATARYSTNYLLKSSCKNKSGQLDVVPVGGVTILLRLVLLFVGLLKTSCYLLYYFKTTITRPPSHHYTVRNYVDLRRLGLRVYFKVVKRNRKKLVKLLSWKSVSPPLLLYYCTTTTTTRLFFLMSPTFFCIIFLHIVMKEKKSPLNTTLAILNIPWGWQQLD